MLSKFYVRICVRLRLTIGQTISLFLHCFQLSVYGHCSYMVIELNFVGKQVCVDNLLCRNINIPAKNTRPLL
jgi:hypothetical protein